MQGDNGLGGMQSQVPPQGWGQQMPQQGASPNMSSHVVQMAPPEENKNRVWWLLGVVLLAALIIIVIVVMTIVLPSTGQYEKKFWEDDQIFTVDYVGDYCELEDLNLVDILNSDDGNVGQIKCTESLPIDATEDEVFKARTIDFLETNSPIMETNYKKNVSLIEENSILMRKSGDHKEFYSKISDEVYAYYIIDKYYLMTFSSANVEWLAEIIKGFTDMKIEKYKEDVEEKRINNEDLEKSEMELAILRQDDMVKVGKALEKYAEENMKKLPSGPAFWKGSAEINCDATNVACIFARDYLNEPGAENSFNDPEGMPYSIYITENLAEAGALALRLMTEESTLKETTEGYTIGGTEPFKEHIMYVVPGGRCSSGDEVAVMKGSSGQYAIIYQVTSKRAYCSDSIDVE